jgi:hypothetical protein
MGFQKLLVISKCTLSHRTLTLNLHLWSSQIRTYDLKPGVAARSSITDYHFNQKRLEIDWLADPLASGSILCKLYTYLIASLNTYRGHSLPQPTARWFFVTGIIRTRSQLVHLLGYKPYLDEMKHHRGAMVGYKSSRNQKGGLIQKTTIYTHTWKPRQIVLKYQFGITKQSRH